VRFLALIFFISSSVLGQMDIQELGRFGGTGSGPSLFKNPSAVDIGEDGRVYICDRGNNRIQVFDLRGTFLKDFGGFGAGEDRFDEPVDIWARSTINIFVADYNNQRIQRYNKNLIYISAKYSNPGSYERYQFKQVLSVAYSPQSDMFILDAGENKVIKINSREKGEVTFGDYDSGSGDLTTPIQVDLTSNHRVLVSDPGSEAIFIFDFFGTFLQSLEYPGFHYPNGIAVDEKNNLYVADPEAQAIFVFSDDHTFIKKIDQIGGIKLDRPVDLALFRIKDIYNMYIIDGDTIIIASLTMNQVKE